MTALHARRVFAGLLIAMAGSPAVSAGGEPLRVPDTMAQRVLACTGCHGAQGRASNEGFTPRIAGKPVAYLQRQLKSFRDGMARLLDGLPDAYLPIRSIDKAFLMTTSSPPFERKPQCHP